MRNFVLIGGLAASIAACGSATLNNCKTFVDRSGPNDDRTVQFGGTLGLAYSPACIEVASGQTVTFEGDFSVDPIAPGTPASAGAGSPNNPIGAVSPANTTAPFPFAGGSGSLYPYYCPTHVTGNENMFGVVKLK